MLTLSLTSACSLFPRADDNPERLYWPNLPSEPRLVYETTLRSPISIQEPSFAQTLQNIADSGSEAGQGMVKPYDVAARDGLIVVSDTRLNAVFVFDVPRRRMFPIGWRGQGKLVQPLGVAIDSQRNIYIADAGVNRIVVFNLFGHYKRQIGIDAQFSHLTDVAVTANGDRVYILDRGGVESPWHRVSAFSGDGELLFRFGERGAGEGQFNHPTQIALGPDDSIYVLDAGNFRVQVFDRYGQFKSVWGKAGRHLGDFARPRGLAVDSDGNAYITDAAYQNFQIFDASGRLLLAVGENRGEDSPGQYVLPAGIAIDETDRIYIVDQMYKKIDVLRRLTAREREDAMNALERDAGVAH